MSKTTGVLTPIMLALLIGAAATAQDRLHEFDPSGFEAALQAFENVAGAPSCAGSTDLAKPK